VASCSGRLRISRYRSLVTIGEGFDSVLDAARHGSERDIARLYRDLNPALVRYFGGKAPDAADDLAQDTWMSAADRLATFTGDEPAFRTWIFTIAHRRLVDHWRRSGRQPAVPMDTDTVVNLGSTDEPVDRLSAEAAIRELIDGMTEEQVEIVLLRVVGGMTVEEVAEIVGKRPGAVRVIQHRALRRAAERLKRAVTP